MRMSRLVGRRYKERPAEATLESHAFLLRGGYARQMANGTYSLLPAGSRVAQKIESILREEMDRIGGQEVRMPGLPADEEPGRSAEAVVDLCRNEISGYKQLPFMVYRIQTTLPDAAQPGGGRARSGEFSVKHACSFHRTADELDHYYDVCRAAYRRVFIRCGIPETAAVRSDPGRMGGTVAHAFVLLCNAGEETVVTCDRCGCRADLEVAEGRIAAFPGEPEPLEKVHTPGMKTIGDVAGFLGVEPRQTAKVVFYDSDGEGKLVMALIRGDVAMNEAKLARIIHAEPVMAAEAKIRSVGAEPGFAAVMDIDRGRCRIVIDHTVGESGNLVCGANEVDYHYRNFNLDRELPGAQTVDVATVREGDGCPRCDGTLVFKRGIELGNIVQLGSRYAGPMGMTYLAEDGSGAVPLMGCYDLHLGRLFSSVMEARHDRFGPIWPISIAPWQVHVNALELGDGPVADAADQLYADLSGAGLEVLFDDRDERPGVQFAEADLIGIPHRFIVSRRNVAQGQVEWKRRDTGETGFCQPAEAVGLAEGWIADSLARIRAEADAVG